MQERAYSCVKSHQAFLTRVCPKPSGEGSDPGKAGITEMPGLAFCQPVRQPSVVMFLGRDEMSPLPLFVGVVLLDVLGAFGEFGFAQYSTRVFALVTRC